MPSMFASSPRKSRRIRVPRALALDVQALEGRKLLSTTTTLLPTGSVAVETFNQAGQLTSYDQTSPTGDMQWSQSNHYNAAGALTSRETDIGANFFGPLAGSTTIETFSSATGHETSFAQTSADGSMVTATYNSAGQETSSLAFDALGNMQSQQIYTYSPTTGLSSVTSTNADGSGYSESFYADGHASSWTTFQADGTSQTTNYRDLSTGTWQDLIS